MMKEPVAIEVADDELSTGPHDSQKLVEYDCGIVEVFEDESAPYVIEESVADRNGTKIA
jgi:hypothetical protein